MAAVASRTVAELRSAPDDTIGDVAARAKLPQAMQLKMDAGMIEKLLASARRGKPAQVVFGRNPMLRFAGQSHVLSTRACSEYHEVYQCNPDQSRKDWTFHGLVSHRLTLELADKSMEGMEGMDAALEQLKNNTATVQQENAARKTVITPDLSAVKRGRALVVKKAQGPAKFLSPNLQTTSSQSTPRVSTPTLLSETQERNEAIKYALIHLLAIKPLSVGECAATIHARTSMAQPILERIAEKESSGDWKLSKRCYKDLDVWGFPYSSTADREEVIENAIDAYDAQRIDPKDNLWQFLLPPQDRFKGKTLSKLKLQQPTAGTPLAKPKVLEKKAAAPKKALKGSSDAKKVARTSNSDSPSVVKSAKDKIVRRDGEAAMTASGTKHGKAGETVRETDTTKKAKAGPAPKTASSKPKTPSPLSSSPPVNASDFEGGHPVHKVLSGSPSPTKRPVEKKRTVAEDDERLAATKTVRSSSDSEDSHPLRKFLPVEKQPVKRAAADERNGSPAAKKVRLDGHKAGAPVRKPVPAPRSSSQPVKRKIDDDDSSSLDSAPLKTRRLLANGATGSVRKVSTATTSTPDAAQRKKFATGPSRGAQAPQPRPAAAHTDSSNSGGTSPEERLSLRQSMGLASKFRRFYKTYEQLYTEISGAVEPPSKERRAELLRMHARLDDMKKMLAGVASRV